MSAVAKHGLDRIPPHNLEAEMALIGSIFVDPEMLVDINAIVQPSDFYAHVHETIFAVLVERFDKHEPLDKISMAETLRRRDQLERVGGLSYLSSLMDTVQTAASATYYAKIVREKSVLRSLIHAGTQVTQLGYESEEDVDQAVQLAEQLVLNINERDAANSTSMHEAALAVITHLINGGTPGRSTGFDAIDRMIAGLRPERFHIIGGRPGQGKTALVLAIAVAVAAAKDPGSVAFFSLEMSSEELAQRIIAARANLDLRQLLTGDLTEREHERAHEAAVWASTLPISIEEAITIEQITSRARRMHARRPLGVLIVDYIQLVMSTNMRKGANPTEVVTTISRRLKLLAKELHIPVIGLSQLNRAVETRSDKRPTLADLRESGALEQDADLVAFVHREAYYDSEHADPNAADFIIAKQRNGPTGNVPLRFVPKCARFENEV